MILDSPSAAMALCGAIKLVEDDPDAHVVVIFPDNVFKYASTFEELHPDVRAQRAPGQGGAPDPKADQMKALIEQARNPHTTVEIAGLKQALASEAVPVIIDVRSEDVYARQHLPGAINIPNGDLVGAEDRLPVERDAPIVTVCNRGNMSITGMLILNSLGYKEVRSLNGGTFGWAEAGEPVEGSEA